MMDDFVPGWTMDCDRGPGWSLTAAVTVALVVLFGCRDPGGPPRTDAPSEHPPIYQPGLNPIRPHPELLPDWWPMTPGEPQPASLCDPEIAIIPCQEQFG